jgi:hypothetical protein
MMMAKGSGTAPSRRRSATRRACSTSPLAVEFAAAAPGRADRAAAAARNA